MRQSSSGGVFLSDLNDFLTPGEQCVLPLQKKKTPDSKLVVHKSSEPQKIKITLDDCLECSGCVTSAETKMLESHNLNKLKELLKLKSKFPNIVIVLSFSVQSISALASYFELSVVSICQNLENFLEKIGIDYTFHTSFANDLSIFVACEEFIAKYHQLGKEKCVVISSTCPGWISFAEKLHGSLIEPHTSRVRSPQAMMGTLIKKHLLKKFAIGSERTDQKLCHVTIQPCFDRKLEAARPEFHLKSYSPGGSESKSSENEIDLVLGTNEFIQFLHDVNFEPAPGSPSLDFAPINDKNVNSPSDLLEILRLSNIYVSQGGGSGGNCLIIFQQAAKRLFNLDIELTTGSEYDDIWSAEILKQPEDSHFLIVQKNVTKRDFKEWTLYVQSNEKGQTPPTAVLSFAQVNGFTNLQRLIKIMKKFESSGKLHVYNYIEAMACPSGGCLNGGAQRAFIEGPSVKSISELQAYLQGTRRSYYDHYNSKKCEKHSWEYPTFLQDIIGTNCKDWNESLSYSATPLSFNFKPITSDSMSSFTW